MTLDQQQLDDTDEPTSTPETDDETTDEPDVQDDEHEAETGAEAALADLTAKLEKTLRQSRGYQQRAQAAERERDELTTQLAAVQAGVDARDWREVEALAAEGTGRRGGIHDPRDLQQHLDLQALRGDDGLVQSSLVKSALDRLHSDRPHLFGDATWAKGSPSPIFQQKRNSSGGWSAALKKARNH